ncbi:peptide/nickel transport system substrate-binding protein [Neorhizobium galegae]|uniref:ABC transporter substrate-binding protein n=1 Tax=Neorhizobium galegae TaxID=399 RepID=UPI00278B789F|nr:ABC transporter substrate-binding protein [Neorhizobium galegae]MDQ0137761.1 peptide/nickel transport system substrate-binding protein [Neorhizobium galegae]
MLTDGSFKDCLFRRSVKLAAACAIVSVCGGVPALADPSGTYRFGAAYEPTSWNPRTQPNRLYAGLVYEGLVSMSPDGTTLQPGLAEAWTISSTEATFRLRKGVTFHDGTPFNADAVIANIKAVQTSGGQWQDTLSAVSDVVKVDDHNIRILLKNPNPTLLYTLSGVGLVMISPKALADGSWERLPDGTGAYKYNQSASVRGSKHVFDYFKPYYAPADIGPAKVELIYIPEAATRYNSVVSGQIDAGVVEMPQVAQAKADGLKTVMWPVLRYHLNINDRSKLFSDARVRKALCMAFPRAQMNQARYDGLADMPNQMYDKADPAHVADLPDYKYDVEGAKALMVQAGNPAISFQWPALPQSKVFGELAKESLAKIGINVEVVVLQAAEYFRAVTTTRYPLNFNNPVGENGGMFNYYLFRFAQDGPGNPFKVAPDAQLQAAFDKSLTATSADAPKLYQEMTRIISDQALDCGYLDINHIIVYDPKKVETLAVTKWEPSTSRYYGIRLVH